MRVLFIRVALGSDGKQLQDLKKGEGTDEAENL